MAGGRGKAGREREEVVANEFLPSAVPECSGSVYVTPECSARERGFSSPSLSVCLSVHLSVSFSAAFPD